MLIKHVVSNAFPIKGKLHIPDVLGMAIAHTLKPGMPVRCVFESPSGAQFELVGTVAFELVNYKGRLQNPDKVGGSLIFEEKPNGELPIGWTMFAHVEAL